MTSVVVAHELAAQLKTQQKPNNNKKPDNKKIKIKNKQTQKLLAVIVYQLEHSWDQCNITLMLHR